MSTGLYELGLPRGRAGGLVWLALLLTKKGFKNTIGRAQRTTHYDRPAEMCQEPSAPLRGVGGGAELQGQAADGR